MFAYANNASIISVRHFFVVLITHGRHTTACFHLFYHGSPWISRKYSWRSVGPAPLTARSRPSVAAHMACPQGEHVTGQLGISGGAPPLADLILFLTSSSPTPNCNNTHQRIILPSFF